MDPGGCLFILQTNASRENTTLSLEWTEFSDNNESDHWCRVVGWHCLGSGGWGHPAYHTVSVCAGMVVHTRQLPRDLIRQLVGLEFINGFSGSVSLLISTNKRRMVWWATKRPFTILSVYRVEGYLVIGFIGNRMSISRCTFSLIVASSVSHYVFPSGKCRINI